LPIPCESCADFRRFSRAKQARISLNPTPPRVDFGEILSRLWFRKILHEAAIGACEGFKRGEFHESTEPLEKVGTARAGGFNSPMKKIASVLQ
jgi:hypothetical protein